MKQSGGPHITRVALRAMPDRASTRRARAAALERAAAQCDCLYPWPALAASLRADAAALREGRRIMQEKE